MLTLQDLRDENSGIQARIARKPQYKCPKCSYTSLRKRCVTAHIKNRNHWAGAHPNGTPKVDQVYSYQNQSLGSSYNMGGPPRPDSNVRCIRASDSISTDAVASSN